LKPAAQMASGSVATLIGALVLAGCEGRSSREAAAPGGKDSFMIEAPAAPTRTGYAETKDARIYYQVHGDLNSGKTPLLVLHGAYMSAESMAPLVTRFAATRPVIAISQRGHGRTGDVAGGITYELLADDASGVLKVLGVEAADVLGYSMGANAALLMALRHPERVGKQVIVAGTYRRDGWHPLVLQAIEKITPEFFAGGPMERDYKRLSPTPNAFATLVEELKALDAAPNNWPPDRIRAIKGKTMVIVGDADAVRLEHAVELFKLRGGGDERPVAQGFMTEAPRARLAILPGTAHVGIMAQAELIARLVTPFLDDAKPAIPPGFFDAPGEKQASTKQSP
jgi:pimeloyl-ACP methyl ester carboxylesterase